jgi:hypothetical protein
MRERAQPQEDSGQTARDGDGWRWPRMAVARDGREWRQPGGLAAVAGVASRPRHGRRRAETGRRPGSRRP